MASQPIIGGMAPTTAPIQVFHIVVLLLEVYINEYRTMFEKPSNAVGKLAPKARIPEPTAPRLMPVSRAF